MTPALFVANYVIEYSNRRGYSINNLRLQKLLYFINSRSLVEKGEPIFEEPMQKWKYGPVVPNVYHQYKQYGAFDITNEQLSKIIFCFDDEKNPFAEDTELTVLNYDEPDSVSKETKKLIAETVDSLSEYGVFELVDKTHQHTLWKEDEERIMNGEQEINYKNDEIIEYFCNHPEDQIWRKSA